MGTSITRYLSPEEVALADEVAAKLLTRDCAHWLKTGEGGL